MKTCIRALITAAMICIATQSAVALVGDSRPGGAAVSHTVAVVRSDGNRSGFCSGVVIAPRVILTAGHCTKPAQYLAVLTSLNSQEPIFAQAVSVHPQYVEDAVRKRRVSVDLALMRLDRPLPARFQPVGLDDGAAVQVGQEFVIAGFGLRDEKGAAATELRAGILTARAPLGKILLWAGDPQGKGFGACTGDSGGPIFDAAVKTLIAITSWATGSGKTRCGALTQGVLVAPHRAWIENTLRQWGAK